MPRETPGPAVTEPATPSHRRVDTPYRVRETSIATGRRTCCRPVITPHSDLPSCAGCGRCCHLVVELHADDCIPEELLATHAGVRCMDQHSDGACVALDPVTRLCSIYNSRPRTCREFARGGSLCRWILEP